MDVTGNIGTPQPETSGWKAAQQREQIAMTLKTLGHPVRIAIMQLLHKHEVLSVGDICNFLSLEQSLTSHHLKNMRLHGILGHQRKGKQVFYSLSSTQLTTIIGFLKEMR